MTAPSISSMNSLTIPGSYGNFRSVNVQNHLIADQATQLIADQADQELFNQHWSMTPYSKMHKFTAHFPRDTDGEKKITILIAEMRGLSRSRDLAPQLAGCYKVINVGESNPSLIEETNAFSRIVFKPREKVFQLELPDRHISTSWKLKEESVEEDAGVRKEVIQE